MSDTSGSGGAFTSEVLAKARDNGALHHYWTRGAGAARIRWGTPGDFDRCVRHLMDADKVADEPRANRICAKWHHDVTGEWPGDHGRDR
jgi:hypothetical protein